MLVNHVATLLDNFSNSTLSGDRWQDGGQSRLEYDGKLWLRIGTSSEGELTKRTRLLTPTAAAAVEAKLAVRGVGFEGRNGSAAFGRLEGTFYTTAGSSTAGNYLGDVWAAVLVGDRGNGLEAWYVIEESLSSDWKTIKSHAETTLISPGTIQLDTEYVVKIAYDGSNGFSFTVGGTSDSASGPARGVASANARTSLTAGVDLGPAGDDFPVFSEVAFDDVKLNNSASIYDDFSDGVIDNTKWRREGGHSNGLQFDRFVDDEGQMVMTVDGQGGKETVYAHLADPFERSVLLAATITPQTISYLPAGTSGRAMLAGIWYNAEYAAGGNGRKGNVFAQLSLRKKTDGTYGAFAHASVKTNASGSTESDLLFQNFTQSLVFDTPYQASIELDEVAKTLTFRFNDEVITYPIATLIYPPQEYHGKWLAARVESGPGWMVALFDDVQVRVESPFSDAAPASHQHHVRATAAAGIAQGCDTGGTLFCPDQAVSRATAAIWLLRAIEGGAYAPTATGAVFNDVGATDFGAGFIEELQLRGFTDGCDDVGNYYCPKDVLTKFQAAHLILKAIGKPPTAPAAGWIFDDVDAGDPGAAWMEELYIEGIADGCKPFYFCPHEQVSMAGFAKMVSRAFGLLP